MDERAAVQGRTWKHSGPSQCSNQCCHESLVGRRIENRAEHGFDIIPSGYPAVQLQLATIIPSPRTQSLKPPSTRIPVAHSRLP
jgi:hypothetical protein